jgi:hypothetical protein
VLDASNVPATDCVVGDFKIKKTTGNFAALNGSATLTHVSAGTYDLVLTTSDVDTVGLATVAIDDTNNTCEPLRLQVVEEAIYDALYAASANGFYLPAVAAGSAGGLLIAGSNAATTLDSLTVTGATTYTGLVTLSDGVLISAPATAGRTGLRIFGNGAGHAVLLTAGTSGGNAMRLTSASGGGSGLVILPSTGSTAIFASGGVYGMELHGTMAGLAISNSSTDGPAVTITGGGTTGNGITITTTDGDGVDLSSVAGSGQYGINGTLNGVITSSTLASQTSVDAVNTAITSAVPDSIPADGSRPSLQQAAYMIVQALTEGGISGTTWTIKKPDGSTTLFTVTLDSATTPTSKTRAS